MTGLGTWAAILVLLIGASGCGPGRPARVAAPHIDPEAITAAVMSKADANGNGVIDPDELVTVPAVAALDRDYDGSVSRAELRHWVDTVKESRVALSCLRGGVLYRKRPLANATVRLVPEPFMGSGVQAAVGTTDADGSFVPAIPGNAHPGVHCGLYRVEITGTGSDGAPLPARYGAESTLGVAIGGQLPPPNSGLALELE